MITLKLLHVVSNIFVADVIQSDSLVARLLFSSLFSSILDKLEADLSKNDAKNVLVKINNCITNMLSSTTQFCTPFIACLLVRLNVTIYVNRNRVNT